MILTRRRFLAAASALALPGRIWAGTEIDLGQGRKVLSLSDGHLELPPAFIFGDMPEAERKAILTAHGIDPAGPLVAPCNVTLLRDGTNTVLFDVGAGPDFQPSAGDLADALAAAGVAPEDVTHVLFTHGHPDHLWGVLDDFDEPAFPEARYLMGGTEAQYWSDPATADSIGAARAAFAAGAKRRLDALGDLVEPLAPGDSPLPGISAVATHGHTPGHLSFDLDGLMVLGDCIGNGHVSFDQPQALLGADQAPEEAAETRAKLMADLAASGLPVLGFHLPGGGIGQVVQDGDAYRFAPS
ncbi:MBL fold metallo-hydrolase [Mangrovicoccus sp. HB161399]|uniref:MBL fold metallo-hydrolase n=1 Tax=Mangrovicoccus sp. HB161399 TaxID=2720392 RepID=UPI0015531FCB|nr:MBL fold metallo-hydrolase [Mangrovicoccus sp. HB161399]